MAGLFPWLDLAPDSLNQAILPGWSFMTINESNSSAPATEQRILATDSYGRQIGRIMDVVELLLKQAKADGHNLDDEPQVVDFHKLTTRIAQAKAAADAARQRNLLSDLIALKAQNPALFDKTVAAAQSGIAPDEKHRP